MHLPLYVEPRDVAEAQALMLDFGPDAGIEAAERAEQARDIGNHIAFCRWRQIERLILMLSSRSAFGTVH